MKKSKYKPKYKWEKVSVYPGGGSTSYKVAGCNVIEYRDLIPKYHLFPIPGSDARDESAISKKEVEQIIDHYKDLME